MFKKYKNDQEFYSLIGIKSQTFEKMIEILKTAEEKRRIRGGRKNKLTIEQRLFMTL